MTFWISWQRVFRFACAVALGCGPLVSCRKPASDAALDPPQQAGKGSAAQRTNAIPASSLPSAESADDLAREAISLAAEYDRADTDEARRVEVIGELAVNSTAAARKTLALIFRTARESEIEEQVIASLQLVESDELEPSLALLQEAIATGQDPELRSAAVEALRDFDSPKTIPIWKTLLDDRDETIRDTAKNMLEFLRVEAAKP